MTRSLRHRLARRRRSPYVWGCLPVISPYADRLRAAAFEPCWRTSPEGREYVAALERLLMNRPHRPRPTTDPEGPMVDDEAPCTLAAGNTCLCTGRPGCQATNGDWWEDPDAGCDDDGDPWPEGSPTTR